MNEILRQVKDSLSLLIQLGAFIWFMSKLNTTVTKISSVLDKTVDRLDAHGERIAHLEGKLDKD